MNYLSHYIIDHQNNNSYYNTALILPDFCKRWIKNFHSPPPSNSFSDNQLSLLAGCLQHYKSDKRFHGSSFFQKYESLISDAFKKETFSIHFTRKWFVAHVLTELLIDRVFVKQLSFYVDEFYNSLNSINDTVLDSFLMYYGIQDTSEFFKQFNHFRSVKYIYYYADNNKFLYSLNRVMMRVGILELSENDAEKLMAIILHVESVHMADATILLQELKSVFKE